MLTLVIFGCLKFNLGDVEISPISQRLLVCSTMTWKSYSKARHDNTDDEKEENVNVDKWIDDDGFDDGPCGRFDGEPCQWRSR